MQCITDYRFLILSIQPDQLGLSIKQDLPSERTL